ncbi:MAG: hypothetical protein L6R42_009120, partial [Xanthoria sp. 1 TBL-2021]
MELVRLTATTWPDGKEVLDVLVRPLGEVLDLNSRFSGVWPEDYANAVPYDQASQQQQVTADDGTTRLRIVDSPFKARELLFKLLRLETPLIGHALENDLNAARILHPTIVDTALLFPHHRGLPLRFGLKMLMKKHLGRDIQMGGDKGHDSKEDARAAGDLVRLRVGEMWRKMRGEGWTKGDGEFYPPLPSGPAVASSTAVCLTMAKQQLPDGKLVYLHCSSVFNGQNALIRRPKKIRQLSESHQRSIKILTKEFTLPAIAAVAKDLLEDRIFESLPRAKLRYPELFQPPSESQEAKRVASEAEVVRTEAEAAQDAVLTSDNERGEHFEEGSQVDEPEKTLENKVRIGDCVQVEATEQQSSSEAHRTLPIPRLHPVYLPYRTQHRILHLVQALLEDCCLDFGNTWAPEMMKARRWDEPESIELTQWTRRFLQITENLPATAIIMTSGQSPKDVLLATSSLRHSAVHRLRTSAAGIMQMLKAAVTFTEALNDSKRAEKIIKIKTQLEASIEEIVQHQNLLERKLTDQFQDIARRRAELDELERSCVQEMLAADEQQRSEVGSANVNVGEEKTDVKAEEDPDDVSLVDVLYSLV